MPTYEYACGACGHRFERFQKMNDRRVRTCPECGEKKVERLISSGAGLVFKGSGFYATDYRKDPPPRAETSGPDAGGKEGGKEKGGAASGSGSGSASRAESERKSGSAGKKGDGGE